MKSQLRFSVLGLLLLLAQVTRAQENAVAVGASEKQSIPFHLDNGFLILVEGRIGALAPLRFLLDTGATRTMVDTKVARKLSLPLRSGKLLNFDRSVAIQRTNLPELQLGSLIARNISVIVGDLKQFSTFAQGVDAIIGLDVMEMSQTMEIDYSARLVTFKRTGESIPAKTQTQAFTVQIPMQAHQVQLLVDTGMQGIVLYQDRLRTHAPNVRFTTKPAQAPMGRLLGEVAELSGVRVGGQDDRFTVFLISRAPDTLPTDMDGYIGTRALNARLVVFDFASKTLRWR